MDEQTQPTGEAPTSEARRKARVGTCWLDGCSGCHMSLLDMDEAIVDVLARADIVFGPLVDAQEWPEGTDVALIEGAVSSQADLELATKARERSSIVVALGDCAVTGNVPTMRNGVPTRTLLERVYVEGVDDKPQIPSLGVPPLLKQAQPLAAHIKVDVHVPGCPPRAETILYVIDELLEGRVPDVGSRQRFG